MNQTEEVRHQRRLLLLAEEAAFKVKDWGVIDNATYGIGYEGEFDGWTFVVTRAKEKENGHRNWHCEVTVARLGVSDVLRFAPPLALLIYTKAVAYFRMKGMQVH